MLNEHCKCIYPMSYLNSLLMCFLGFLYHFFGLL